MKRHILVLGVLYVLFSNNIHASVKVDFTGGSSISGDLLSWDGEKGIIKCDLGEISVDKTKITPDSLMRIEDAVGNVKSLELMLKNGSLVKGKVLSWDGRAAVLEADIGNITVPAEKLSEESSAKLNGLPKLKPRSSPSPETTVTNIPAINDASDYKALSKYIVIVEGDKSVGTGFIAQYEGKTYLFTNLHVLDGNKSIKCKTMQGKELALGKLLASTEYD